MRWWWQRDAKADETDAVVEERAEWIGGGGASLQSETASLDQADVVRQWLHRLATDRDGQVFVHRRWGSLVAAAEEHRDLTVMFTHGDSSWFGVPLNSAHDDQSLTPVEVERVMVDALTATERPTGVRWSLL